MYKKNTFLEGAKRIALQKIFIYNQIVKPQAETVLNLLEKERDVLMKTSTKLLALACCLALFTGCCGSDKKDQGAKAPVSKEAAVLNVYGWADYFDPALLEQFEKQNKCKVTYDVFGNNEELLAKMQAGGAQYDVIMPSDYMVTTMTKLDMLAKLDFKNIPNAKNIDPKFKNTVYDPKNEFTVPFVWGMTGIVYNKKYIKEAPTKWDDLWKPEYKGHLIVLNEVREHFNMALKKHGYSNNSKDPKELEIAFKDLQKLNDNVLAYDTATNKQKFIAEEAWIGNMTSGDAAYCHRDNPNIAFMVPDQGSTIWADSFCVPKGAKHKELAEKFINFMCDPKVSAQNFDYIYLPNPNTAAKEFAPEKYKNDEIFKVGDDSKTKGEWFIDLGDTIAIYDKYWTQLRTGK